MKIGFECPSCLLSRGTKEIEKATDDPAIRTRATLEVVKVLSENLGLDVVPSYVATLRDRVIRRVTGNPDPYLFEKRRSNEYALKLLPKAMEYVDSASDMSERFGRACLCAAVGNAMEFDIEGYSFQYQDLDRIFSRSESELGLDHRNELYRLAEDSRETLLLTDNAGEIVFDTILAQALRQLGGRVVVAVKGGPILNDATMDDAEISGMKGFADLLLTTGNDCVGFCREESSREFLDAYQRADLVIAKGMGHLETLTEESFSKRIGFILKAKCRPVADFLGSDKGKYVIMLA